MATDKYLNLQGLEEVANRVNQKLKVVTTIPANPNDQDIILYKGVTSENFIQGCEYLYEEGLDYYAWKDGDNVVFTLSPTPSSGDAVYEDTAGTLSSDTVDAYDATNDEITINGITFARDNSADVNTSQWVLQDTSVILNGTNQTGNEADFYAPTTAGTTGQVLVSNGTNAAPTWSSFTGYSPSFLDNSLVFTYGEMPEVDGNSLIFDLGN